MDRIIGKQNKMFDIKRFLEVEINFTEMWS
jgi:hypothetical protein